MTLVRAATAAYCLAMTHAAHERDDPTFAHAISTTESIVTAFRETGSTYR